ncbi:FecCD family ABC transporter permease [Gorillibacterium timonense]|uniref:FecCD family ABC transporter permease n=1 Tax=Gorillibacterium timonense TaxID=1689269 RepID=UPI00071D5C90|nr:iron ABC transporter permease [Gorillibacterium timonense]
MRMTNRLPVVLLAMAPVIALLLAVMSVLYGAKSIQASDVWQAIAHFDPGNVDHQVIRHSRLPRALGALLLGACLAVSGAVMQGITRNDLASPSLLGVLDGSVFAVTVCMVYFPHISGLGLIGASLIGSALGTLLVFGLLWLIPGSGSPVTLAILGTLTGMFLNGVADALSLYYHIPQKISYWYNSRLYQMDPELIRLALPFAVMGLILVLFLSKRISILSLGEEQALGLGVRVGPVKVLAMLGVTLLSGITVALAGKIAFIGLIVPHIARKLTGSDYRWIIPISAVLGGLFLAFCDILARFVNAPFETPIGVVTALFGVPFFLYLIRRKGGSGNG